MSLSLALHRGRSISSRGQRLPVALHQVGPLHEQHAALHPDYTQTLSVLHRYVSLSFSIFPIQTFL